MPRISERMIIQHPAVLRQNIKHMAHPVCDFAHHMTKVALAGTGIFLSDGATNVMPIGPHRGEPLSFEQMAENRESVHQAWRTGFNHTMHSLINGFYQGWDLNLPSYRCVMQLPIISF